MENTDFGYPLNIYSHSNKWMTYCIDSIEWFCLQRDCQQVGINITLCWGTVLPTPLFSWFLCMLWNSFQGFPLLWPTTTKSSNPWIICYFLTHCSYYYLMNYLNKTEYSNLSQLLHYQQNAKNMYYTIYIWKCSLFSLSY